MKCRTVREALDALLDGELESGEEREVRQHLDWCLACAQDMRELREWHGTLSEALSAEGARPSPAERRRTADAVIAAVGRRRPILLSRWAALLAIGLSLGAVSGAVILSRPQREQVARVADRIRERDARDATLRAMSREIEEDLGEARRTVANRGGDDLAARAVAVASVNIARRLGAEPLEEIRKVPALAAALSEIPVGAAPGERVLITRTVNGTTISLSQMNDGRIRVVVPSGRFEAGGMDELRAKYPELCRRYSISGSDGCLAVGDASAGADWKGRLDLLFRTGAWNESVQWEAYRGLLARRVRDTKEVERKLAELQDRCRAAGEPRAAVARTADIDAILKGVKALTRAELNRTQERVDAEMRKLEERLKEVAELRVRAKGLRIIAEYIGPD